MLMTTSAHNVPDRALEELSEQIVAVTKTLENLRENYTLRLQARQEEPAPPPSKSGWSSVSIASTSKARHEIHLSPLPSDQHPIVLATWATSSSDSGFLNSLGHLLSELISEKRRHSR
ncbi:hypothetical protein BGX27_008736 [Mortierella sp. AM989]|nr:hypothetical protein BGX27_008736 [Mortierella sp. AM989]